MEQQRRDDLRQIDLCSRLEKKAIQEIKKNLRQIHPEYKLQCVPYSVEEFAILHVLNQIIKQNQNQTKED